MGWATGSEIMMKIMRAIEPMKIGDDNKVAIYKSMIDAFFYEDWDTEFECAFKSKHFDRALYSMGNRYTDYYEGNEDYIIEIKGADWMDFIRNGGVKKGALDYVLKTFSTNGSDKAINFLMLHEHDSYTSREISDNIGISEKVVGTIMEDLKDVKLARERDGKFDLDPSCPLYPVINEIIVTEGFLLSEKVMPRE